jgi:NAD(P)-dependent dehydrogenase (short-subunit alcohol dehydrogenase family)
MSQRDQRFDTDVRRCTMVIINGAAALVTGGQRGLGKAFVNELLARGAAKVYATARDPKPSDDPRVIPLALDVTDQASVDAAAAAARDVSIVVNNAGVGGAGGLLQTDIDDIRAVFETNLFGAIRVAQAFVPTLAANGGGALVDIHSALSWIAGAGAYGASKAAFWSATNSLRLELAPQNTLVVGVHLGYADTDLTAGVTAPKLDPREVATAVVDGVQQGRTEVLVDDVSRHFKQAVAGPVENLSPSMAAR